MKNIGDGYHDYKMGSSDKGSSGSNGNRILLWAFIIATAVALIGVFGEGVLILTAVMAVLILLMKKGLK